MTAILLRWKVWDLPGEGTPIPGHGREVMWWWPPFLRFSIQLDPYFMPHHDLIDPLFLSLSHLVPEILGPKVDPIFTKMYYFVSIFSLIFGSNWPLLSFIIDLFDPSFLQNLRSDWVHFLSHTEPLLLKIWWSIPRGRFSIIDLAT